MKSAKLHGKASSAISAHNPVTRNELLRALPSVDELVASLHGQFPHALAVRQARILLAAERERLLSSRSEIGQTAVGEKLRAALDELSRPSLRHVINATGVILHTNLGRAPLAAVEIIGGYSNLEYDLETGKRGKRDVHVGRLLEALLGCPAIAVNNNAGAVYLVLNELAAGGEVIVSRGELIEIGDGFRIPEIMERSGAILREIGTTNKTSIDDYRDAITERTRLILRVHPSNFHMSGFTAKPSLRELAAAAREHNVPLYEDLGSGCIVDLTRYGIREPLVSESLDAGADLVSFSTDKLLGGPQSGIIAGNPALVGRVRRNPMFRALRLDKIILQVLADSLRRLVLEQYKEVPAIAMIAATPEELRVRIERLGSALPGLDCEVVQGESVIGGGSTPDQALPTWLLAIRGNAVALERKLRGSDPPVIARIENDQLVLDLRTVSLDEEVALIAVCKCL